LRQLDQNASLINPDEESGQATIDRGLRLNIDLQGNGDGIVGYRAMKGASPIDLDLINHYEVADFWIPIYQGSEFILEPGEFYILASKERVRVPPDLAAELLPYDLATQEFRIHYAGFFDPGFGYGKDGEVPGTRAVLEVRANEMPILLEDDQFVGRLHYYYMSDKPNKLYGGLIGSNYQHQGLALSKQFKKRRVNVESARAGSSREITPCASDPADDPEEDVDNAGVNCRFSQASFGEWVQAKPE